MLTLSFTASKFNAFPGGVYEVVVVIDDEYPPCPVTLVLSALTL